MVGITTWHAFFAATHLTLHERHVLVLGYGLVGQGLCEAARAYGACVTVCEPNPVRAMQARYAGWHVVDSLDDDDGHGEHNNDNDHVHELLSTVDVICTATGMPGVLGASQMAHLKSGVFLLNAGHAANEIDVTALTQQSCEVHQVMPHVQEFLFDNNNRSIFLLCGGSMANLTAGEGDSINAFDVTLAVLTAGIGHLVTLGHEYCPGLHTLPEHVWRAVL